MVQQNTEEQVAIFSALADPTRLKLVKLLCHKQDPDALCVNALAGLLRVTQSAVSQHMRVLKAIGLVKGERRGYHIHYAINQEAIKRCLDIISTALSIGESARQESCQDCNEGRKQNVSRE